MLKLLAEGAEHAEHVEPTALGFMTPGSFVALAMIVVLGIMLWKGVPAMVAKMLDDKIAGIREQLDTASKLRVEAEALKADYERKARDAEKDIEALRESAEKQAADIVAKAKEDATALIRRHKAVSVAKIASAERSAIEELRARAASAATIAARNLIADQHDAKTDKVLADQVIAEI